MNNLKEIFHEAKLTFICLAGLIFFWLIAGFATANIQINIFNIPIWALLGTVGVWLFAILISLLLSKMIKDTEF